MRIEYHRTLIADHVRNAAFFAALKACIEPGKSIVADIGTGTGLIGVMAARLGAKRVYMYETAAIGAVAEQTVRDNKLQKVCEVIACHSADMIDPPRADVVVSETLGNYALEENIISTLSDGASRHLKPGGRLIPSALTQFVAPVTSDRFHRELTVWDGAGTPLGIALDLSHARAMSANNAYVRNVQPSDLLPGAKSIVPWDRVDFAKRPSANRKCDAGWRMELETPVFGFAVWWSVVLGPGLELSTAPDAPWTHWEQLYFPLADPVRAKVGDEVRLTLRSKSSEEGGTHLAWTAIHSDAKGRAIARLVHDLDKGYLP